MTKAWALRELYTPRKASAVMHQRYPVVIITTKHRVVPFGNAGYQIVKPSWKFWRDDDVVATIVDVDAGDCKEPPAKPGVQVKAIACRH